MQCLLYITLYPYALNRRIRRLGYPNAQTPFRAGVPHHVWAPLVAETSLLTWFGADLVVIVIAYVRVLQSHTVLVTNRAQPK